MKRKFIANILALSILLQSVSLPSFAEETANDSDIKIENISLPPTEKTSGPVIRSIVISGNQRLEKEAIISFMGIKQGDPASSANVNNALKALLASGYFADATIKFNKDYDLLVEVTENSLVNEVFFEGNKKISDELLKDEVPLSPRDVYSKEKVANSVSRIIDLYHRSGRIFVTVSPKIIKLDQNRLNVVFEIKEGKKAPVSKIDFIGNNSYSKKTLEETINSKEKKWYRFGSTYYDPDRISYDAELLRKFYMSKGYADFEILNKIAEFIPDSRSFIISFVFEEGLKFDFGDYTLESEIEEINLDAFKEFVVTKKGEVFNADLIEETIQKMVSKLNDIGFAFADVDYTLDYDRENKIIDIHYVIKKNKKIYVNKINISGNDRTLDSVIRRELRLLEGDAYSASKLRRSKQRLENLGFFSGVEFKTVPTNLPDQVNIDIVVKEKSTGELNFGLGYSTTESFLGNVSVKERNLMGKGHSAYISFQKSSVSTNIDLSYTVPYFLGKDRLSAGFDIFNVTTDYDESSYESNVNGFALRMAYELTEYLTHSVKYSYRNDEISNIDDDASIYIKEQEGKNVTSLVGNSFLYDKRDNKYNPKDGYYTRWSTDVAGLGGDSEFIRNELSVGSYKSFFDKNLTFKLALDAGNVIPLDDGVRINHRFFIGGSTFRGFENAGIGPRDLVTEDALGGNSYYVITAEMLFPIGLPEELGFKGLLFSDTGTLFDVDITNTTSSIADDPSIRSSAGFGILWDSPLGPVRVEFGQAFMKEDYDKTEVFRINFGTKF